MQTTAHRRRSRHSRWRLNRSRSGSSSHRFHALPSKGIYSSVNPRCVRFGVSVSGAPHARSRLRHDLGDLICRFGHLAGVGDDRLIRANGETTRRRSAVPNCVSLSEKATCAPPSTVLTASQAVVADVVVRSPSTVMLQPFCSACLSNRCAAVSISSLPLVLAMSNGKMPSSKPRMVKLSVAA
jgi:hypothetical protein